MALGVLLPQVFHLTLGPNGGVMFLPMHLAAMLAGCFLGWQYGVAVGACIPLLSFLFTQMPPVPLLFVLMAELAVLGLASGVANKRLRSREHGSFLRIALAALISILCSRAVYLGLLLLLAVGFGLPGFIRGGGGGAKAVFAMVAAGWPGILLQLAIVPALVRVLHKIRMGMKA